MRILIAVLSLVAIASISTAQLAITTDWDGDGIPNEKDVCPKIPAARDGIDERLFCGPGLHKVINDYVFLWSRTFRQPKGIEKNLFKNEEPFHAFLHVAPHPKRKSILPKEHAMLEKAGVTLLGYIPHRTWYARFDSPKVLELIVKMSFVHGVSSIRPKDRIDPFLRLEGRPIEGLNKDGSYTLSVTFLGKKVSKQTLAALEKIGAEIVVRDGNEAHIKVSSKVGFEALAKIDQVESITDIAGPPTVKTDNGRTLAHVDPVDINFNLFGAGLTVAMAEPGVIPIGHTDLEPRVTRRSFYPYGSGLNTMSPSEVFLLNQVISQFGGLLHAQKAGSIIAGSGATLPGFRGLLPSANLISYSVLAPLHKQRYYRNGQDAKINFSAAAINHSWGPINLNRPGMYLNQGRWLDRVVRWHDLPVIWAAGNERCGTDCENNPLNLVPSLPHPVAKNDISVGNISANDSLIAAKSSSGPAADGRLKPDIVAPGDSLQTVAMDRRSTPPFFSDTFSGTSASAPFVTGIVGMMTEKFIRDGRPPATILPALIKAILLETADDIGARGPDFFHGYGRINAKEAIRAVGDTSRIIEGDVQESDGPLSYILNINELRPNLSATLVWTDVPGQAASTLALINDLDLTITSPSGIIYRSFNLMSPPTTPDEVALGSSPCTNADCTDILNTVEQVFVDTGGFLEMGIWTITVTPSRVIPIFPNDPLQDFSIAVSAACPVIISRDTTLTDDIACPFDPLAPEIVRVVNNVTLDCNEFTISGDGFQVGGNPGQIGISVENSFAIVRNCNVEQVPTGIKVASTANAVELIENSVTDTGKAAIELHGTRTTVRDNELRRVHGVDGAAILVRGGASKISDNNIYPFPGGQFPSGTDVGIHWDAPVNTGSGDGFIRNNDIDGASFGIIVDGAINSITGLEVHDNKFEGTRKDAITIRGDVSNSTITENIVEGLRQNGHGITLTGGSNHLVSGNPISAGMPGQNSKTCIHATTTQQTVIRENTLINCGIGIFDSRNSETSILENTIEASNQNPQSRIGIYSFDSEAPQAREHIARNTITSSEVGILISGYTNAHAQVNTLIDLPTGILVRSSPSQEVMLTGNPINVGDTGIRLEQGSILMRENTIIDSANPGQLAGNGIVHGGVICMPTETVRVLGNTFEGLNVGLELGCDVSEIEISGNSFIDSIVGVKQNSSAQLNQVELEQNVFKRNQSHALFEAPVIGAENTWDDIRSLRIFDSNGDGHGDCGQDYPYTSRNFSGQSSAAAVSDLSTQVQDVRPVTSLAPPAGC